MESFGPGWMMAGMIPLFWAQDLSIDFSERSGSEATLSPVIMTYAKNGVDKVTIKGPIPKVGNFDPSTLIGETLTYLPDTGTPAILMTQMTGSPSNVTVNNENGAQQTWTFNGRVTPPA